MRETTNTPVVIIRFDYHDDRLIVAEGQTFHAKEALKQCGFRFDPKQKLWTKLAGRTLESRPELQEQAERLAVAVAGDAKVQMIPAGATWLDALIHDGNEWRRAVSFLTLNETGA